MVHVRDIITLGEALIDFVPTESGLSLAEVSGFSKRFGGAPANLAVGLAKLGSDVGFIGKVGDDSFGDFIEAKMRREGVETSHVYRSDRAHTTLAFVSLSNEGERDFIFYRNPGADQLLTPAEIRKSYIAGASVFHFGSLSLTGEDSLEATVTAVDIARENGVLVSMDPNIRLSLWDDNDHARAQIMDIVDKVDILKLSLEEAYFLSQQTDVHQVSNWLAALGPDLVLITQGGAGSFCRCGQKVYQVGGYSVEVKDTTGAGDGFMAGFLDHIYGELEHFPDLDGSALTESLHFANATAALTTTDYGATSSFPERKQVQEFLQS